MHPVPGSGNAHVGVFNYTGCRALELKQASGMVGVMVGDETVLDFPYRFVFLLELRPHSADSLPERLLAVLSQLRTGGPVLML